MATAVVTGGTSGCGLALIERSAALGMDVAAARHHRHRLSPGGPGVPLLLRKAERARLAFSTSSSSLDPTSRFGAVAVDDDVSVRVWRPTAAVSPLPALLWIHGGGSRAPVPRSPR
jgi:NAD(P)-dependent dehydrogenase (short-subunit alcohol dehydrogenase family)